MAVMADPVRSSGGFRLPRRLSLLIATCGLALVLTTLFGTYPASALSCPQRDPRDFAGAAQIVVSGAIQAESLLGIRVRVDRVYQGTAEQTITVLPGQGNANRVGQLWTFYLGRNATWYNFTECDGSHPGGLTPEEGRFFTKGIEPNPDQHLFGQVGNVFAGLGVVLTVVFLMTRRRRPPMTPAGAHP
jgi:hypothetical protein